MSLKPFAAVPKTDREWQKWVRETYDEGVLSGNGSPLNVVTANIGTLYRRLDGGAGTSLYIKESGNGLKTGWRAV
jgi:hypothetical protein